MQPCSIHDYESALLLRNNRTTLFLLHFEQRRYPSCPQRFHVQIFSQYVMGMIINIEFRNPE